MINLKSPLRLATAFTLLLTFSACLDGTKYATFNFPIVYTFNINPIPNEGFREWGAFQSTTDWEAELNTYGATLDGLEEVTFESGYFEINTPAGQTFDAVDYAELWIGSTGGLSESKVAYRIPVPQTGLDTLNVASNYVNMADYLKQDAFMLYARGYNNVPVADTVSMTVHAVFRIKARIL